MMLTKKQQQKYLAKRNKEWKENLAAFSGSHDPEALHQLRVALKKLNAIARFSKDCTGGKAARDFKGLKAMFKQAGVIRDAGNHLHLLEHFHMAPQAFREQQDQLQATATEQFVQHIKDYRRQGKRAGRRLLSDVRSIPVPCIRDWFALHLVKTGILLTATGDQLHKARKRIKELLYVEKVLPSPVRKGLGLDINYLHQLQDAIGQWHDAVIVVSEWAGKDLQTSQAMVQECREKENAVRLLANDFYRKVHT
jgi:CHAD domain-containing protein